jgi:hypothetical protein
MGYDILLFHEQYVIEVLTVGNIYVWSGFFQSLSCFKFHVYNYSPHNLV